MKAGDCASTTFEPRTILDNAAAADDDVSEERRQTKTIVVTTALDSDIQRQRSANVIDDED